MADIIPLDEQLLDTWNIHNRINLYMLDAIAPRYYMSFARITASGAVCPVHKVNESAP